MGLTVEGWETMLAFCQYYVINVWLTDSYLRAMKWNAWKNHVKNFMADDIKKYQRSVGMIADSSPD